MLFRSGCAGKPEYGEGAADGDWNSYGDPETEAAVEKGPKAEENETQSEHPVSYGDDEAVVDDLGTVSPCGELNAPGEGFGFCFDVGIGGFCDGDGVFFGRFCDRNEDGGFSVESGVYGVLGESVLDLSDLAEGDDFPGRPGYDDDIGEFAPGVFANAYADIDFRVLGVIGRAHV